jgi:prepilin-type N-terminal cleavage/methylation domain-containing protein
MKSNFKNADGFTMVELLVVIAVIAVLAALLLPVLSSAKANAQRAACLNNLKQINFAVQMYAGANGDTLPAATNADAGTQTQWSPNHFAVFYKSLVKNYAGLQGPSSPQDKLFACPADKFFLNWRTGTYSPQSLNGLAMCDYSSYGLNGLNGTTNAPPAIPDQTTFPGIAGLKLASLKNPLKTVLVFELSGCKPWSWHDRQPPPGQPGIRGINNAMNMVSFADGHIDYIKMFFDAGYNLPTAYYDPPAGYDYQWSPN